MHKHLIALAAAALSLAACSQDKPADTATTTETSTTTTTAPAEPAAPPADAGVARTEAATPAPAPAPAALATQPGPKSTQVALTKARVVGDILSVELQYSLPPTAETSATVYEDIDQVNYIDDATSRKYEVLKDQQGKYMASPLSYNDKQFHADVRKTGVAIVTLKFPAPPATSQTISLSIPEAGSFDAVAVQR
ncbi:hypothetical protein [Hymenobacter jeollabukensis]|uniref:Uncharacterized protein n=1 Tax=Hymenobacter jeollabukensis TaxID=2025313 RepID=A0A5R8WTP5_9BACT|nr:hypothetical protein [Hymenobacter jeollabukensis]TLM94239.1 hypothetical protein FDY95_09505 [Hymenobacter jeollabukensis]